jgi:hypothetical protein
LLAQNNCINRTKEEGRGTGIGLYMSKIIIENDMLGSLSTFNDEEGANFFIQLKYKKTIKPNPVAQQSGTDDAEL